MSNINKSYTLIPTYSNDDQKKPQKEKKPNTVGLPKMKEHCSSLRVFRKVSLGLFLQLNLYDTDMCTYISIGTWGWGCDITCCWRVTSVQIIFAHCADKHEIYGS